MSRIDRRTMLKLLGLGAGAAASPFAFGPSARAGGGPPLRFVVFYAGDGLVQGRWNPRAPGGVGEPTETSWELGELYQPLAAYQSRMTFFENLDMRSKLVDSTPADNAHADGLTHSLTGATRFGERLAGGPSIDQYVAQQLQRDGLVTPRESLVLKVSDYLGGNVNNGSFRGPGEQCEQLGDPRAVYEYLFPTAAVDDGRLASRRALVMDLIRQESTSLAATLPVDARRKVEAHLDMRSDIEASLALAASRARLRPELEPLLVDWDAEHEPRYNDLTGPVRLRNYELASDVLFQLGVAALHTDTTRVVTFNVGTPSSELGYTNGDFGTSDWHNFSHVMASGTETPTRSDPAAQAIFFAQKLRMTQSFAQLVDLLAAAPEADGSSLLEHTIVLFAGHIADPSHSGNSLPWTLLGDGHGAFRTGRYLRYERTPDPARASRMLGRPHNDLFVSISQAMGAETDTFGNPEVCNGPLEGLA
ncbi:MAG: DUF1552 domain-containing protein [Myxococcota bacterium]|nr:DUF1552 domain-containing protein [Myxococcota bacterium]